MRFLWVFLLAFPLPALDLAIAPQSLTLYYQFNSGIFVQQFLAITTPQPQVYTASRPPDASWLNLAPSFSRNAPDLLPIVMDPTHLAPGRYTSAITFRFAQATVSVPVTLIVSAVPVLVMDPGVLVFDTSTSFISPLIGISGPGNLIAGASTTTPWLKVQRSLSGTIVAATYPGAGISSGSVRVQSLGGGQLPNAPYDVPAFYLGSGLASHGPLTFDPAALSFTGSGGRQIAVSGGPFTASSDSKWLTADVAGQNLTVGVNTAGLDAGAYSGTVSLVSAGVLQVLPVALTVGSSTLAKVVNAASYADGPIAPGEVVALFGSNLGPAALAGLSLDAGGKVSTTAGGVRVLFDGVAAPLIYASATQVAAVAPYELDGKTSTTVQVEVNGQVSNSLTVPVRPTAAGIFTADASGRGAGAILNSDNRFNGPQNPAAKGGVIAIYMTGEGQTVPVGVNGLVTGSPALPRLPVTVTIDGQAAAVQFAGEAPGLVSGVMQVNAQIPAGVRSGEIPLAIAVGGVPSQTGVTVSVR